MKNFVKVEFDNTVSGADVEVLTEPIVCRTCNGTGLLRYGKNGVSCCPTCVGTGVEKAPFKICVNSN